MLATQASGCHLYRFGDNSLKILLDFNSGCSRSNGSECHLNRGGWMFSYRSPRPQPPSKSRYRSFLGRSHSSSPSTEVPSSISPVTPNQAEGRNIQNISAVIRRCCLYRKRLLVPTSDSYGERLVISASNTVRCANGFNPIYLAPEGLPPTILNFEQESSLISTLALSHSLSALNCTRSRLGPLGSF